MWIMGTDFFLSVVRKDCSPGQLLVRARREGDIEKVFGKVEVQKDTTADYLFRARIDEERVAEAMRNELRRIDYGNYKSSVRDKRLHDALLDVWTSMSKLQDPPPYSSQRPIFPRDIFEDDPPKPKKTFGKPTRKGDKQ